MEGNTDTIRQYAGFVAQATAGDSPSYAEWARGVAGDREVLAWLQRFPRLKQQPNLVFAAARWHGVPAPAPYDVLRRALLGDDGAIEQTIRTRATQTNEARRMATLLPAFQQVLGDDEPVALLEVGASAGLCLYPDLWGYEWATDDGPVLVAGEPRLRCRVTGPAPLPTSGPRVVRRAGIDLNPLDVADEDAMAWLEALVWPEHEERRAVLRQAIAIAREVPPTIVRGDLLTELPGQVHAAAGDGTVIVFHSAVVSYLADEDRERFDSMMRDLVADGACHWVSNEGAGALPRISPSASGVADPGSFVGTDFVLGIDGRPVARTDPHGRALDWLDRPADPSTPSMV